MPRVAVTQSVQAASSSALPKGSTLPGKAGQASLQGVASSPLPVAHTGGGGGWDPGPPELGLSQARPAKKAPSCCRGGLLVPRSPVVPFLSPLPGD